MSVKRITPVLFADAIEPCLLFWMDRLGFNKTLEVPDGDRLGFAILQKNGVELMYQSFASGEKDVPGLAEAMRAGSTFLYVEVDRLDDVMTAMRAANLVLPLRTTSYGAKEIGIKDPAGHVIVFAEMPREL